MTVYDSQQELEEKALRAIFGGFAMRGVRYAILRNFESLPYRVGARDIDILVMPNDLKAAIEAICVITKDLGCQFAQYFHDDMIIQVILFRRLEEGEIFELKIDLLHNRQVYGVQLLSAERMMKGLRHHNGIPIVLERFVFLDKWLFNLFVGHPVDAKYDAKFSTICKANGKSLVNELEPLIGQRRAAGLIANVAEARASEMPPLPRVTRVQLLARTILFAGPRGIGLYLRFLSHRMCNLLAPRGVFISVSGPDGSGKTTVIDQVVAQLGQIYGGDSVEYHHFRPTVLPRIAEVAKTAHAIKTVDTNFERPHRARPSGPVGSLARLGYYWLDYVGGYLRTVRPALVDRKVVLFDRYYYDMISDPGRSRIALPVSLLRVVARLIPLPQFGFFIRAAPEEVRRRKQELTLKRIRELNERYGDLVARGLLTEIDNNGAPEVASAQIVDTIIAKRDTKARRALRKFLK